MLCSLKYIVLVHDILLGNGFVNYVYEGWPSYIARLVYVSV